MGWIESDKDAAIATQQQEKQQLLLDQVKLQNTDYKKFQLIKFLSLFAQKLFQYQCE